MLLFKRPDEPAGFAAAVSAAKRDIDAIIARGEDPKSEDFKDVWGSYKHLFAEVQHHKCGFCERNVLGGDDGDVEHFRPKAQVQEMLDDPRTWGKQRPHSASLTERETPTIAKRGYYWLAYAWDNYLFSCRVCNQKCKRCVFPVEPLPRLLPPRQGVHEEPLLLDCYGSLQPREHLKFNPDGSVEPFAGSRHGYETIRTFGLDREPLRKQREEKAVRVHHLIDMLNENGLGTRPWDEAIKELRGLGREDREFAGMVRTIVEQECGLSLEQLTTL